MFNTIVRNLRNKPKITLKTAQKLRSDIIKNYYRDIRRLKRKLTFEGVDHRIADLEARLISFLSTNREIACSTDQI